MNKDEFDKALNELGVFLKKEQQEKLDQFYKLLIEENQKINLTRITEKEEVYLKHFYDSLTLVKEVDLEKIDTLCDVGSGAGFPGIVLKIVYPNLKIILLDSLLKRVNYLNETIKKLNLENIKAIHTRSEDYKEKFDIVTSRAVAPLDKLIPWCIHLLKEDGIMIAMKANVDEELKNIDKTLKKYHCQINKVNKFILPKENSTRSLVIIKNSDKKINISNIKIRKCRKNDIKEVYQLICELKEKKLSYQKFETVFQYKIKDNKSYLVVAKIKDKIIGFLSLNIDYQLQYLEKIATIRELIINEKYRGNGIGKLLIDYAMNFAKENQCKVVELTSGFARKKAHQFYLKNNFEKCSFKFRLEIK